MLSQTAEYAMRSLIYLARNEERRVRVDEIAEVLQVPRNYLSKILYALSKAGVLDSLRGPRGGFQLAGPAGELSLLRIIELFDELEVGRTCLLGHPECSDRNPCAVHTRWKGLSEQVARFFRETTLEEVANDPKVRLPLKL